MGKFLSHFIGHFPKLNSKVNLEDLGFPLKNATYLEAISTIPFFKSMHKNKTYNKAKIALIVYGAW